jgi:hypothetical protein
MLPYQEDDAAETMMTFWLLSSLRTQKILDIGAEFSAKVSKTPPLCLNGHL